MKIDFLGLLIPNLSLPCYWLERHCSCFKAGSYSQENEQELLQDLGKDHKWSTAGTIFHGCFMFHLR